VPAKKAGEWLAKVQVPKPLPCILHEDTPDSLALDFHAISAEIVSQR
jgi:hypothetical protein